MSKKKILVVDDHGSLRYVLSFDLNKVGYEAIGAANAEEGLKKAATESPDLIIMDMMMPGIDGLEATRLLKRDEKTKNIPVIMLTARSEKSDVITAVKSGVSCYIVKPYQFNNLYEKVVNLIGKA
ncbi:MAG: response regulator [Candidatus Aureabacteria bacterium]|nr:response regulator [Candidatus Auribacterota bacterium]